MKHLYDFFFFWELVVIFSSSSRPTNEQLGGEGGPLGIVPEINIWPESVQENEIYKILWDFKIQKDHQIPTRGPDFILINKKIIVDFAVLAVLRVKCKKKI